MIIQARAKINLYLRVTGKREDGYHTLETVFQPVTLCDEIELEKCKEPGLQFTCSDPSLVSDRNLVCRAFRKVQEHYPAVDGVRMHLEKRVPMEAGMGGGSGDAAAVIRGLDQLFALHMPEEEMIGIGASLGADVPACLFTYPTEGRGIGEILTKIDCRAELPLVVLKPQAAFSTPAMFRRIDEQENCTQPQSMSGMVKALEDGSTEAVCRLLYNQFEEVVPEPELLKDMKDSLMAGGAKGAMMTGSGSCVFGIFASRDEQQAAAEQLRKQGKYRVFVCETTAK